MVQAPLPGWGHKKRDHPHARRPSQAPPINCCSVRSSWHNMDGEQLTSSSNRRRIGHGWKRASLAFEDQRR